MQFRAGRRRLPGLISCFSLAAALTGCGGSHEETVAGVQVPVPSGMNKSEEKGVELSLPGFGGGQATYRGKREPDEIVEFYQKELPARGWKPSIGVISKGGMLTYVKEDKSLVVMVTKADSGSAMSITVGEAKR